MSDKPKVNQNLTDNQKDVLFRKGTEAPHTGTFLHKKGSGMYTCVNCGHELFSSTTKFESGSGWPSFYDVAHNGAISLQEDSSEGMNRIEVMCAKCGGHLGHVFEDGPDPTGKRFCINSCVLDFHPQKK